MPTANFSDLELRRYITPARYFGNLDALARLLESLRSAGGGVPLRVNSTYRSPTYNAAVGGSPTSQHLTASAADVSPLTGNYAGWARTAFAALPRASYGQAIVYPWTTKHVHVGLPNRASGRTGELLCEVGKNRYLAWDPSAPFPTWGSTGLAAVGTGDTEGAASSNILIYIVVALVALAFLGSR